MSFRINVQYLHSQRKLIQEQLAMLVGGVPSGGVQVGVGQGISWDGQAPGHLRPLQLHP